MRVVILGFLLLTRLVSFAADPKYPVSEIPESLLENSNVIIRESERTFQVASKDKSIVRIRMVLTILNENGKDYATQAVYYDKFRKVNYFKGSLYDAKGNVIKKLKPSEIYDQSAISGFSVYEDNRVKVANLSTGQYPFTVEFEYELENKFLYSIPEFRLPVSEKVAAQKITYNLIYPLDVTIKYKSLNVEKAPTETIQDKYRAVVWEFENVKVSKGEALAPSYYETQPTIIASPEEFDYLGYPGKMDNWKSFGAWFNKLNEGRDELTPEAIAKVKSITEPFAGTEAKVKALYEYMQSKTRYVSIQLGIGGLQPFEAKTVEQTGYGDCKALSNYMVAMLKQVGIKGYYTLIYGGDDYDDFPSDFTSDYFNHIVVAVPTAKDTIWLECTSQTNPFGYLGSFTSDRYALMITEDGGKLVRTPAYDESTNIMTRKASIEIDNAGNADAIVETNYRGMLYEYRGLDGVINGKTDDQKKWILYTSNIPSFDVKKFSFSERKDLLPEAVVTADLRINRLANVSGKRMFITPNIMNRFDFTVPKSSERKSDIVIQNGFTHIDSIAYSIPEEIYPEFLPESTTISNEFGEYESAFRVDQGKVVYVRKFTLRKGRYAPQKYTAFQEFMKSVSKADNTKLVFLTKT